MAHVITEDDINWEAYEQETDARQSVKSAKLYVQQLIDRAKNPKKVKQVYMPWGKTHRLIQYRKAEVTIYGGENGTGKSIVTGQVGLSLCAQDEKVAIASFEMKPDITLERMGAQWTKQRIDDPAAFSSTYEFDRLMDLYEQFRDWTDGKLWLYDKQGTVHWRHVCAVARYCAKELGITQFILDNLMKCVAGEDDYNGQKAFIDELCSIARDTGMHIHVVHHVKKPDAEGKKPTKYSLKGTGAISDQADNVILVWRDKVKERAKGAERDLLATKPDTLLIVDKQRNGKGWEGNIGLWYRLQSQQFVGSYNAEPMDFYNPPQEECTDE